VVNPSKNLNMIPTIVAVTTVVPTVLYLLSLLYWYFRGRLVFRRGLRWLPAPAPAAPRARPRASGIVATTAAVANPLAMQPLEVEVEAVPVPARRVGGAKPGERDSISALPVVEAHSVAYVDDIPAPSAPPGPWP
jgi:hypothetical protein